MTQIRRFEDQVVVITGSAKGIGFATAELAAQEGAKVVICDLERDAVDAAVKTIITNGGTALGVVGDVANQPQVLANVDVIMAA